MRRSLAVQTASHRSLAGRREPQLALDNVLSGSAPAKVLQELSPILVEHERKEGMTDEMLPIDVQQAGTGQADVQNEAYATEQHVRPGSEVEQFRVVGARILGLLLLEPEGVKLRIELFVRFLQIVGG
jgi:hypothetical protein